MRHGNARRDMSRASAAKRKRKQRDALREKGLKVMQVWVRPRDRKKVREFVAALRKSKRPASHNRGTVK